MVKQPSPLLQEHEGGRAGQRGSDRGNAKEPVAGRPNGQRCRRKRRRRGPCRPWESPVGHRIRQPLPYWVAWSASVGASVQTKYKMVHGVNLNATAHRQSGAHPFYESGRGKSGQPPSPPTGEIQVNPTSWDVFLSCWLKVIKGWAQFPMATLPNEETRLLYEAISQLKDTGHLLHARVQGMPPPHPPKFASRRRRKGKRHLCDTTSTGPQ